MTDIDDELVLRIRNLFKQQAASIEAKSDASEDFVRPVLTPRRPTKTGGRRLQLAAIGAAASVLLAMFVVARQDEGGSQVQIVGQPTVPTGGHVQAVPSNFRAYASSWVSSDTGWLIGTGSCSSPPCSILAKTVDGGATWSTAPGPRITSFAGVPDILGLTFADARNGWVITSGSGTNDLWVTHDGGVTWGRITLGVTGTISGVVSIAATPERVYATVIQGSSSDGAVQLFSARVDDDRTWARVPEVDFPHGLRAGARVVVQGRVAWVTGGEQPGTLAFMTVDGTTWERRSLPCQGAVLPVVSIAVRDPDEVALICTKVPSDPTTPVYVSHDRGRTFTPVSAIPAAGTVVHVAQQSSSSILVASTTVDGERSIHATHDGGATWSRIGMEPDRIGWADLEFLSDARVVALPRGGKLHVSDDAGRTWRPVSFG